MLNPAFISLTGADDKNTPEELLALHADHPVEFAILFSKSREGKPRYPKREWIRSLDGKGLRLAAHLCGVWARDVVEGRDPDMWDGALSAFSRVQINVGPGADPAVVKAWADRTPGLNGVPVTPILQCRGDVIPDDARVNWLYDTSGGLGKEPDTWPTPPSSGVFFGYAGGMGPANVRRIIENLPHTENTWIDMETRVRDADDVFSLDLCRQVCTQVYGR